VFSPHKFLSARPWNTSRFGLLLVLDAYPTTWVLAVATIRLNQGMYERRRLVDGCCDSSFVFCQHRCGSDLAIRGWPSATIYPAPRGSPCSSLVVFRN